MIYYIIFTIGMAGTPDGTVSDLFEDAFLDRRKAEESFQNLEMQGNIISKELWMKDPSGVRKMILAEKRRY